ncbi:MAG: hypothetical protein ACM3SX_17015, partial [Deltaproteobacteria bacterium]
MTLLAIGLGMIALAGFSALAGARISLFRVLIILGSAIGAVPAVRVLLGASSLGAWFDAPPPLGPWVFGIDALSALFLVAVLA